MKSASPVDRDVAFLAIQTGGAFHAATRANTTELEQTVKDGTVVSDIVFALLAHVAIHVVWRHLLQKVDVVICMELGHLPPSRGFCALVTLISTQQDLLGDV